MRVLGSGNLVGAKPYTKGRQCSKCASGAGWCQNGLCVGNYDSRRSFFVFLVLAHIRRVPKNCAKLFLSELRQISTNFTVFGTQIEQRINLCEVRLFSTSLNSCQRLAVLNAAAPNSYITLQLLVLDCSVCVISLSEGAK